MDSNKWKWRTGEIGYATFLKLSSIEKEKHIQYLLQLDKNILSTNDEYILRIYGPSGYLLNRPDHFISLDI